MLDTITFDAWSDQQSIYKLSLSNISPSPLIKVRKTVVSRYRHV